MVCRGLGLLGLLVSLGVARAAEPVNLVRNPGFEDAVAGGVVPHWQVPAAPFGALDGEVAHTGTHSLRLGTKASSFVTCFGAPITVKPATRYKVTWWCRTAGMRQARAYVWLQTNRAQRVMADDSQSATTDWTQHWAEYLTAADETTIQPVATTHDVGGEPSRAWFDDLGIYEGSFPAAQEAAYQARLRRRAGLFDTATVLVRSPQFTVWADELSARIYREDGVPATAPPAAAVPLSAARNETVYHQVAIRPGETLPAVTLVPSDLAGPGTIPAASVQWWPVGFANVKTVHRPGTRLGQVPDPLWPAAPTAASSGLNTPFLIGVSVPADARAGDYRGTVAVQSNGRHLADIPLALHVSDFALPADPTFRTLITFDAGSVARFDRRPVGDVERDICRVLAAHGVRGLGATVTAAARIVDGRVVCDFTAMDARIEWCLTNLRFNAFFLGPCFGGGTSEGWQAHHKWLGLEPLSPEFRRLFPEYLRQVGAHLRAKGWLDKAYLYLWDEPEPDYFDKVVELQKLALQGDPGFKIWETTSPSHRAFWNVVKAWSVPFGRPHFVEEDVAARRVAGDEIWVYNIPASLEIAPAQHRLWFWQAARYGAMGAQLWNVTFYHGIDPWETITPAPYPVGRNRSSLYYYDAGEAILLYPNPHGGLPLASLRLKLLQKGLDDYEYLHLYEQALTRTGAANAVAQARTAASALVHDLGDCDLDPRALQRARDQLASAIEQAGRR